MTYPLNIPSSGDPSPIMNDNGQTIAWAGCYGHNPEGDNGALIRGYHGGRWGGFTVVDTNHTFGASTTTYVSATVADGTFNFSTSNTNFNDTTNYKRIETVVTDGSGVTGATDYRGGPGGVHGSGGGSGGSGGTELKGLTFTSDTGSTADSDPGNGLFKWNNATEASATFLYFDNQTLDAISLTTFYASLGSSGFIYLQQSDDATKWQLWKWTTTPTAGSGYYKFAVTLQASGGSIADNKTVYCDFSGLGNATGASTTQTDEFISGYIASPTAKTYKIVVKASHGGTFTETTTISESGTGTATFKINTTALGGTANAVSSSEVSQAQSSANVFSAGDDIQITMSSLSTLVGMSFTMKYTRTYA